MIVGVLLAAGASLRMGRDKLSLPWRGTSVLSATLEAWTSVEELDEILLVLRREGPALQRDKVRTLVNVGAEEGMGSSLRVAARALSAGTEAVVVGLADMPDIASSTVRTLIDAWRPLGPVGIVAPVFQARRGHPVVFGAGHIPALQALGGDEGARSILESQAADVRLVAVQDPGVLLDLDTPADMESHR